MYSQTTKHFAVFLTLALLLSGLAVCNAALQENTNLITNAGFESGSTGWPTNASYWQVVSGTAHAGTHSMRFVNNNAANYVTIGRSLPVQTDCKYSISAWVKTQNVSGTDSGATIALEYYDSNWNYLGGVHPAGIKGTTNWTKISTTSDRIPSNTARVYLYLYLRKGCTGTAWFDDTDARVSYENYLFRPLIIHPHYRNTILPGQTQRLILGVQAAGNAVHPTSSLAIDVSVKDPLGRTTTASAAPAGSPDSWASIYVNLPGSTPGAYGVTAKLVDKVTRVVYQSRQLSFVLAAPTAPMPKVYVDNLNRCVVDGQTFFPIGLYCWANPSEASAYLNRLAGTKFNCLMNYSVGWYTPAQIKSYLDLAQQKGVKAIFSVKDCYDGSQWALTQWGGYTGTFNVLKGLVSTYKSHPAVLAWYLNDELSGSHLPAITERYDYIAANDYNHPVWQVLYKGQDLSAHVENTDVLGVDNYPVWYKPTAPTLETFGQASDDVRKAVMAARGVWMVGECASIQADTTANSRPPTYQEIMCEAYQALTSGARGLVLYSLSEVLAYDGETQWAMVRQVGEDLYRVKSIALGTDPPASGQTSVSDARVRVITRSADGATYTLAVNPYNQSIPVKFTLGSTASALRVEVGAPGKLQGTLSIINRSFNDTIEPHGTRVYKLVN